MCLKNVYLSWYKYIDEYFVFLHRLDGDRVQKDDKTKDTECNIIITNVGPEDSGTWRIKMLVDDEKNPDKGILSLLVTEVKITVVESRFYRSS